MSLKIFLEACHFVGLQDYQLPDVEQAIGNLIELVGHFSSWYPIVRH
jgi:hypothetical protein